MSGIMTANEQAALAELEWLLYGPHTYKTIGERLGVSKQRVEQIEKRAIRKLRSAARGAATDWEPRRDPSPIGRSKVKVAP